MKLPLILLVMAVLVLGACRVEEEARWTTNEPSLVPVLTAANDFLRDRGEPIWRDDVSPNTRVVIDPDFEQKYPNSTLSAGTESRVPICLKDFCLSEEKRHTIRINPARFNPKDIDFKAVIMAHEFKHALGQREHVETCPHLMNSHGYCQPPSLEQCTKSTC